MRKRTVEGKEVRVRKAVHQILRNKASFLCFLIYTSISKTSWLVFKCGPPPCVSITLRSWPVLDAMSYKVIKYLLECDEWSYCSHTGERRPSTYSIRTLSVQCQSVSSRESNCVWSLNNNRVNRGDWCKRGKTKLRRGQFISGFKGMCW